ncbi:phosphoribosyl-ATP diphosphatase [Candidatus Portiera aleyrodidarum]|uniref:phosphoribosyl-ATP diphosphatase n=1 Tax=Candidatus Portiera aleyrodidarum TaxID=91844 RepID=UPI000C779B84|nr:phosphoribosyl-ATP diphosphatase [Candidatus Portiera aleyrodidarum]AUI73048.1 phosphoribosyl-ATP diphosphatase [Candidatus Portiera aleyrodidarum]AUI73292.1 phosphoribosyl-ATP diphosphatase [Candidatus Portiera aleyrodidarum]
MDKKIESLFIILQNRKKSDHKTSYLSGLYNKDLIKTLNKIKEEINELIVTIKKFKDNKYKEKYLRYEIIKETADVWLHSLICISFLDICNTEIVEELYKRLNISGLKEKTNRVNN